VVLDANRSVKFLWPKLQVKRDEDALTLSEKEVPKGRSPVFIEAANLSIKDSAFNAEMFGDPCGKLGETVERISVPRNEFALPVLDMRECAEPIDLQFVNE
jgi:hypothetical protein